MSRIIRGASASQGFTIIANAAVRDASVSLEARGLLAQLMSHAEGWETSERGLAEANGCGRQKIRTALDQLKAAGYVTVVGQGRDGDGRFQAGDWLISDTPTVVGFSDHGSADHGPPYHKEEQSKEDHVKEDHTDVSSLVEISPDVEISRLEESEDLAKDLARRVAEAAGTKPKPPSPSSVKELEKMMRIDGVSADKIRRMLVWLHESECEDAEFWKGNVLSGAKLREKWATLAMKANAQRGGGSRVQRVQHRNQSLLFEANRRITAEEACRERALPEAAIEEVWDVSFGSDGEFAFGRS